MSTQIALKVRLLSALGITSTAALLALSTACQNGVIPAVETDTDTDSDTDTDTDTDTDSDTDTDTDTDVEPTCDPSLTVITQEAFYASGDPAAHWLACMAAPDDSNACPTADAVNSWQLLADITSDLSFCGFEASVVCGPEATIPDRCCYEITDVYEWCEGRPFTVQGTARVAALAEDISWCADFDALSGPLDDELRQHIAAGWAAAGQDEHGSVASFARFALQLMALGAPADLIASATRAQADEITHARACFGIASAIGGRTIGPGPIDISGAMTGADDLRSVVIATIREGCIGETVAAAIAAHGASTSTVPEIAGVLSAIADDETRHAAMAWRFVKWALEQDASLAKPIAAELAIAMAWTPSGLADADADVCAQYGRVDPATQSQITRDVLREVIGPCAVALLVPFQATRASA